MVLSKKLNGALVKQKRVPFPKARNQEGMQVTLKVCCLKTGMPTLRGRLEVLCHHRLSEGGTQGVNHAVTQEGEAAQT